MNGIYPFDGSAPGPGTGPEYSSIFYKIFKGIKIGFHSFRFISYLMTGSFIAALYSL